MRPDLEGLKVTKNEIFKLKIKLAEQTTSLPWKMSDLEGAFSQLKNNKSRDPDGYINEIFKCEVIGQNLKESLLTMFNKLKSQKQISYFMNVSNITTVPKKGSRIGLKMKGAYSEYP